MMKETAQQILKNKRRGFEPPAELVEEAKEALRKYGYSFEGDKDE